MNRISLKRYRVGSQHYQTPLRITLPLNQPIETGSSPVEESNAYYP